MKKDGVINITTHQRQFIDHCLDRREFDVLESNSLGFLSRVLVQTSLPHSEPSKELEYWYRQNGDTYLYVQQGISFKKGKPYKLGYPYGSYPRLVLFYLCTEAVRTQEPLIDLGNSMSEFMRGLGLHVRGGNTGDIKAFKMQTNRLLNANIRFGYDDDSVSLIKNASFADEAILWWDEKQPNQDTLFKSSILLNQPIFKDIIDHPIPIDKRIIQALRKSPFELDLYVWLTHRVTYLNKKTAISYTTLAKQTGAEYADIKEYGRKVRLKIQKIKCLWPELKVEFLKGRILLEPCKSSVIKNTLVAFPNNPLAKS